MKLLSADRDLGGLFHRPVLTMGNFDGVHRGHQLLMRKVCEEAHKAGGASVAYTFNPHPVCVLDPRRCPPMITSTRQKIDLIAALGVQFLIVARFTLTYAAQSAWEFAENVIHKQIGPQKIIIGENFSFGRNREGNPRLLAEFGKTMGFEVEAVPPIAIRGTVVSSTIIRECLHRGDVGAALLFLGRPYAIQGIVIYGHTRGRTLGYPTANIRLSDGICPAEGVYAARVEFDRTQRPAVVSIGRNPTFGEEPRSIEVHILRFDGNLYGKEIQVSFVERLRDQMRFASQKKLIEQIARDIQRARDILAAAE